MAASADSHGAESHSKAPEAHRGFWGIMVALVGEKWPQGPLVVALVWFSDSWLRPRPGLLAPQAW